MLERGRGDGHDLARIPAEDFDASAQLSGRVQRPDLVVDRDIRLYFFGFPRRWCMNPFVRTEPIGGPTYFPPTGCDSGLPSSDIRFNTWHPSLASRFCDS